MSIECGDYYAGPPPELNIPYLELGDVANNPIAWNSNEIQSQLPTDILLMVATDEAFLACYYHMKQIQRGCRKDLVYVDFGQFVHENDKHVKVALMRHEQGLSETQTAVKNAAQILNPKVTLLVGTCETLETARVKLGDVVIAMKLATYDDDKIMEKVSPIMAKLIPYAADGWKPPLKNPNSFKVKVQTALMLSGSDSIKNRESLKDLQKQFPNAVVIEKGGKSLYEVAYDLKMEWAVIKGVSNLVLESEEVAESWKRFSCAMAASVIYNMFNPVVLEGWPRYREAEVTPAPCCLI